LLAHGWDTFAETLTDLRISVEMEADLDRAKAEADKSDERGAGLAAVQLGAETLQIAPHGGRHGVKWILANDDFRIDLRSPRMAWNCTVRYSAAGLWEHGLEALRGRVHRMVAAAFNRTNSDGVGEVCSSAHYAFDFYSPAFTEEMGRPGELRRQVVAHQETDIAVVGTSAREQTLTIGKKTGLQVQVYDKTTEITEVSGKGWMRDMWQRNGFEFSDDEFADVWRVECRWSGEYLKNRNLQIPATVIRGLPQLVTEALFTHRLAVPSASDSNRRRWPLHPLWTAAYLAREAPDMLPLGRVITGRRDAMLDRATAQIVGAVRSYAVLRRGECNMMDVNKLGSQLDELMRDDPKHEDKVKKAAERYRFVDEAS